MKTQLLVYVTAGFLAGGCSKNNDVNEVSPIVFEQLDSELDAMPPEPQQLPMGDAQTSDGGVMVADGGDVDTNISDSIPGDS